MALPIYRFLLLSIVPSFIGAVLVHKVNSSCFHVEQKYHVFDMPCTSCHINMFMDCPNGTEKITEMNGASGCTYEQSLGPGPNVTKDGCYHTCRQEVNVTSCCPGYWGSYCDECPGGSDMPCNGHGNCSDGLNGTGQCSCQALWTGYSCELCTNSSLVYPNCTDIKSLVCNMTCPNNSKCAELAGEMVCMCEWPYIDHSDDDEQIQCKEADFCVIPPLCHVNASCAQNLELGEKNCTCNEGFHGDGYDCNPNNPCQINNGDCDPYSTDCVYVSPGKSMCNCKYGFHEFVPNHGCSLIDICDRNPCHARSTCAMISPFTVSCRCKDGYIGNGYNCTGNILQTLEDLNTDDPEFKGQLNLIQTAIETFYKKEMTETSPITIFVPVDDGFKSIGAVDFQKWLLDEHKVKALLRQHILVGDYLLEYLHNQTIFYTLDGVGAEVILANVRRNLLTFGISGGKRQARILKSDIEASNGIIHITKRLLVDSLGEIGNPQMTADRYIASLHPYSIFHQLIEQVGSPVRTLLQKPGVTVFAPPNEAWDKLPWDSLEYLLKPENKAKVEEILKNHIIDGRYEVTDFFNIRRLQTLAGYFITITVDNGRFIMNDDIHITNADIVVENGLLMKTDAVLVPDGVSTLPNFCNVVTTEIVMGPCGDCRQEPECLSPDVETNETVVCEYYARNEDGQYEKVGGCAPMCNRKFITPHCCKGFYGFDCLPCPGGYRNPCNGHGVCDESTGVCQCDPNFGGIDCSECDKKNYFGPTCTQECTCVEGICKDGPLGDGTCRSCFNVGFSRRVTGENCDKLFFPCGQRAQNDIHCHVDAMCVVMSPSYMKCMCNEGYTGDGETKCSEIDPCQTPDYGGCDRQATCEKTGPGMNNCTCNEGWTGDGTHCYLASVCRNHSNCHENASCIETFPGSHVCRCHEGFHGDGIKWCVLEDMCAVNNGGCHPKAACTNDGPGRVNCTCLINQGYSGNGYTCTGNVITAIMDDKRLSWIANILTKFTNDERELFLVDNYTVFAPHDEAISDFVSSQYLNETFNHWMKKDVLLSLLNYHTLQGRMTLDKLVVLSMFGKLETMQDGFYLHFERGENNTVEIYPMVNGPAATVLESDIIVTNGYLNIIDKILLPSLPVSPDDYPDLETFFQQHPKYSMFGEWLIKKNLTKKIESDYDEYTLFVPTNNAMKHLKKTVTTDYLLYHLVNTRIMTASYGNTTLTTALGPQHQLDLKVYGWFNVTVNRVQIVDQDMFTFGGLVNGIDGLLHPVLHRCREINQQVRYGPCNACGQTYSCYSTYELLLQDGSNIMPCKYQALAHGAKVNILELDGCQGLCYRNKTRNGCCSGYYGQTCAECPGGPETPCSGHGQCKDGIKSNGQCVCDRGFTGYICDTCMQGWTGQNCETDMRSCAYRNGGCDSDALCNMETDDKITCVCLEGFKGDGYNCTGPCEVLNGGCHSRATCLFRTSSGIQCKCTSPFVGDGKTYCNADVLSTLLTLDDVSLFVKSTRQLADESLMAEMKNSSVDQKLTLFVPVDSGLEHPFISERQLLQQIVKGNTSIELKSHQLQEQILISLAGDQLLLRFNTDKNLFFLNDTYVIKGNIPCTNGIIHLMSGPITPAVSVSSPQASKSNLGATVGISVAAAFLCLSLAICGIIYWKKKSRSNYWEILKEWRSKKRTDSTSQEESFHVKEEEDDVTQSDTNFGNPLYLVQNLD